MSEEITEWFNTEFWPLYPSDLAHGKKGPKSVALKSMLKLNPDDAMRQDIMNKLRVLIRFAKTEKRCGKEPDRWPFASTWINQERWDAVEDMKMPSTVIDKRVCSEDGCNRPVAVCGLCDPCYDKKNPDEWRDYRKKALIRDGMWINEGETYEQFCKRHEKASGSRLAQLRAGRNMGGVHR